MEPSAQEYARFYELTKDHLETDPFCVIHENDNCSELLDKTGNETIFDIIGSNATLQAEHPHADDATLSLLIACTKPPESDDRALHECLDLPTHRFRDLKQELPLLRRDPEVDLRKFKTTIVTDFENEHLPFENVDENADEGLEWPPEYYEQLRKIWRDIRTEKLSASGEAFVFLKECVKPPPVEGGIPAFEGHETEARYQKSKRLFPITPPLLPMSPETSPYVPSSETGRLDFWSEATNPLKDEIAETERLVFKDDVLLPKATDPGSEHCSSDGDPRSESLGDIYSPLRGLKRRLSTPPPEKVPIKSLKVEVPWSPANPENPPPWERKNASFSETLSELIPEPPQMISASGSNVDEEIDAFFDEAIAPIAMQAERSIEHEQLQEADTVCRVKVPVMDSSPPEAPWNVMPPKTSDTDSLGAQDIVEDLRALGLKRDYWPLSGKVERELTWVPFPASLADVCSMDTIVDDGSLAKFLEQPESVDPYTLIWKPDGLRIFDDLAGSEEEDLAQGVFPDGRDVGSLARKRQAELLREPRDGLDHSPSPNRRAITRLTDLPASLCHGTDQVLDPIFFSTSGAMNVLQGHRARYPGHLLAQNEEADANKRQTSAREPMHKKTLARIDTATAKARPTHQYMPLPGIVTPPDIRRYTFSTGLLNNRPLARRILSLYPTADVIERDSIPAIYTATAGSGEADVIISPSTGLIHTTLQKIKQRALPGAKDQSALSPVQHRLFQTIPRYERLLVLVSQNIHPMDTAHEVSPSDCIALAEFTASCTSQSAGVSVMYIPGGEEVLAMWIVALMIKYSLPDPFYRLAQEESPEERFLERAGLNPLAAQVIIGEMEQRGESGLGTFVLMPLKAKLARFESLLGGRKCLMRVHKVLEAHW